MKEPTDPPDPHGHAALLLVESLIHELVDRSLLTVEQAIQVVQSAADVKEDLAEDAADTSASTQLSLRLLNAMVASLMHDIPRNK